MHSSLATTLRIGKKIFVKVGHKDRVKIILFRCTAMNIGRKCIWYKIKRAFSGTGEDGFHTVGDFPEEYQLEHVRSGDWACTRCCNSFTDGSMCRCSDIYDDESFERCQGNLYYS